MKNTTKRAPARKPAKPANAKAAPKPNAAPTSARKSAAKKPRTGERRRVWQIDGRRLNWRGVLIAIHYRTDGVLRCAQLELRVISPAGAPIPITESGDCSLVVGTYSVERAGGPVAYVRRWLDTEAGSKTYLEALARWRQLDLFT